MEEIMRAWDMFEIVDQEPLNMVALYFLNRCPAHPLGRRGIVPRRVLQDGFPMSRRCFVFQAHAHLLLIASAVRHNLIHCLGMPEVQLYEHPRLVSLAASPARYRTVVEGQNHVPGITACL